MVSKLPEIRCPSDVQLQNGMQGRAIAPHRAREFVSACHNVHQGHVGQEETNRCPGDRGGVPQVESSGTILKPTLETECRANR